MHRETVASTMRVNPGLLEKQQRQQRRQQQSCVNIFEEKVQLQKRNGSFENAEFGLLFLDNANDLHPSMRSGHPPSAWHDTSSYESAKGGKQHELTDHAKAMAASSMKWLEPKWTALTLVHVSSMESVFEVPFVPRFFWS